MQFLQLLFTIAILSVRSSCAHHKRTLVMSRNKKKLHRVIKKMKFTFRTYAKSTLTQLLLRSYLPIIILQLLLKKGGDLAIQYSQWLRVENKLFLSFFENPVASFSVIVNFISRNLNLMSQFSDTKFLNNQNQKIEHLQALNTLFSI